MAQALGGSNLKCELTSAGRCNVIATCDGLFVINSAAIKQINAIHESITVATIAPHRVVRVGDVVATVKRIPFTVIQRLLDPVIPRLPPLHVMPFVPHRVGVISTMLSSLKSSVIDQTTEGLRQRLAPSQSLILIHKQVPHEIAPVAFMLRDIAQMTDLVIILGASVIKDRQDVVPAAIERAGGTVVCLGTPVQPGDLLLLGLGARPRRPKIPVVGASESARSTKENGFDVVLNRLLAKHPLTDSDVGVGVDGVKGD